MPTPEFRDEALRRRRQVSVATAWEGASDPERAERNLRERDRLLAWYVLSRASALGLTCIEVDGTRSVDEMAALLERHFAPLLPAR